MLGSQYGCVRVRLARRSKRATLIKIPFVRVWLESQSVYKISLLTACKLSLRRKIVLQLRARKLSHSEDSTIAKGKKLYMKARSAVLRTICLLLCVYKSKLHLKMLSNVVLYVNANRCIDTVLCCVNAHHVCFVNLFCILACNLT